MAKQKLPAPATSGEMYLNAAVEELQRLNENLEKLIGAQMAAQTAAQDDEVTLKEPAKPATRDAKRAQAEVEKAKVPKTD